jgi:hypothetical protein
MWYWTADPSSANTSNFCNFNNNGNSNNNGASNTGGVAPMSSTGRANGIRLTERQERMTAAGNR